MTRAAEDLGTTQPAVSHALGSLERELRIAIFVRHRDGVTLTGAGRSVSRRAALILTQLEGLHQEAAAARGRAEGHLRVGVIPSVNARLMPSILRAFAATYDRVRLTVLEGSDGEVLEWLRTGAVDVATVTSDVADLATTPLASDRMVAILPAAHPLTVQASVTLDDLARHPFIMSTGGCEPLIADLARRRSVRLRSHYRVRDANSILAMVAEQLGVTIMPELALPAGNTGVSVVPLSPEETRSILLALPADASPLPAAAAFVELACGAAVDPSAPGGSTTPAAAAGQSAAVAAD